MANKNVKMQHRRMRLASVVVALFVLSIMALAIAQHLQAESRLQSQTRDLSDYLPGGVRYAQTIDAPDAIVRPLGFEHVDTSIDGRIVGYSFAGSAQAAQDLLDQADLPQSWMYYVVPLDSGCSVVMQIL